MIAYVPSTLHGCAACDFCLNELEMVDQPIVLARKILSCVARVGQRFGATHVATVLRGQANEQVTSRGHQSLSTFGLLPDASVAELRGYIDQLVGLGLLQQTDDPYPVLVLSARGLALLKDERSEPDLALARQRPPKKGAARTKSRAETESWQDVDRDLFERLQVRAAGNRAGPRCAALRGVSRRDAARNGQAPADDHRRTARRERGWRAEGGRPWRNLPRGNSRS